MSEARNSGATTRRTASAIAAQLEAHETAVAAGEARALELAAESEAAHDEARGMATAHVAQAEEQAALILQRARAQAAEADARILGHADVAPDRKEDPGELFPWKQLAEAGHGLWVAPRAAPGLPGRGVTLPAPRPQPPPPPAPPSPAPAPALEVSASAWTPNPDGTTGTPRLQLGLAGDGARRATAGLSRPITSRRRIYGSMKISKRWASWSNCRCCRW